MNKGIDYNQNAELLEGYSGSDIKLLCKEALMTRTRKAINIIENDNKGRIYNINEFPVTKQDFEESLEKVKPAFTYKTERYEKWMKERINNDLEQCIRGLLLIPDEVILEVKNLAKFFF